MSHWLKLPERGTNFALNIIFWVGTRVGRWAARLLLYPITLYFLITSVSGVRRGSAAFFAQVLNRKPGSWDFARQIHAYSATILDRVFLLAGEFGRFDIRIRDAHVLLDRVEAGQGCILLGAHLGSFEVMRVLGVAQRRLPLRVLMNVDHNSRLCSFLDALNPEIANTVIPLGTPDSMIKVKESLTEGHLIGMLGDRVVADDKVVRCKFLDRDTA
ncbi:MAG: lipid A biosynthesis acyltransferase, partial [Gammaproteobacteria bacterium]